MTAERTTSASKLKRKIGIPSLLLSLLVFLGLVFLLVRFLTTASARKILWGGVAIAMIAVVGFLGARFEVVDRTVNKFLEHLFGFCFLMMAALLPVIAVTWLSRFILVKLNAGFQIAVFIVWGLTLAWAILLVFTEKNRERLFLRLQKIGSFSPVAYSISLLMIATIFFSSVTYVLVDHGLVSLVAPTGPGPPPEKITDFYMWHFLEAVPLLKITETLHWKEPLSYTSGWVGLLLLLFKLTVNLPVIAVFTLYWKQVSSSKKKSPQSSTEDRGNCLVR